MWRDFVLLERLLESSDVLVWWDWIGRYNAALGGWFVVGLLFLCYITAEVVRLGSSAWLSVWTDETKPKTHGVGFYNAGYAVLAIGQVSHRKGCAFFLSYFLSKMIFSSVEIDQTLNSRIMCVVVVAVVMNR